MANYQALYRAWRPDRFEDVCGQEAITRTLRRQITSGHIGHAYLFCGSRGTGKTTTAKVLARAVNCLNTQDGEPCGECEVCRQLINESSMDVLEIDAASNNGVDEVRLLRDRIAYPATVGRYKVYIIDEVHMLSTSAFNALLKTLEEPPSHAIFILATTEPQKLPATVLSRCQRYDFKRIPADVIVKRMRVVLSGIHRAADDQALSEIAAAAEGGMRDALSLLDMCLSYAQDTVTAELVREVLGSSGRDFMFQFVGAVESGNAKEAMCLIDRAMRDGRDAQVFAREAASHMRTLLMAQIVDDALADLAEITPEDAERFREQAGKFERTRLMRALDLFMHADGDMKWVANPRSVLEVCAVRASAVSREQSVEGLTERMEALEKKLREGRISAEPAAKGASAPNVPVQKPSEAADAPEARKPAVPAPPSADQQIFDKAISELAAANAPIRSYLPLMKFASREQGVVSVRFDKNSKFQMQLLERKSELIEKALSDAFGEPIRLNMQQTDAAPAAAKAASGTNLARTFDIFGRDKVEVID